MSTNFFDQNSIPGQAPPKPLSCTNCRHRKIKCNKLTPCLPCQTSGRECVYPSRTRNRRPQSNKELLTRVSHLESLVRQIGASSGAKVNGDEDATREEHYLAEQVPASNNLPVAYSYSGHVDEHGLAFIKRQETGSRVLGHTFWTSLSEEVGGLRKLLEDNTDDDEEPDRMASNSPNATCLPYVLFNSLGVMSRPEHPSDLHRSALSRFYVSNVHPVCKVLHWPTTSSFLESTVIQTANDASNVYDCSGSGFEALTFAIYFSAVTSMSDVDCMKCLGAKKGNLVAWYKQNAEAALAHANFLSSTEIDTLQALVLYIMAMRSHDSSRSSWTLIGLAVRIAQDLGLHRDGDGRAFIPFDAEIRRRLWWQIIVLDVRASEDRGSETMIADGTFNTIMPRNLNDDDFNMSSRTLLARSGITEMTFPLICMDVCDTILKISFIPPFKERRILTFQQKEELAKACATRINLVYLKGSTDSDPNVWVVRTIGELLILKLWLVVQYPLQCVNSNSHHFARGQSLRIATAYLRLSQLLEQADSAVGFLWLFNTYVPWHALAVALVELCKETQGLLVDQAWSIIDKGYDKWRERTADSKGGVLWRPLKSLMKKARAAREPGRELALPQSSLLQLASESSLSANWGGLDMASFSTENNQSQSHDPSFFDNLGLISPDTYPYFSPDCLDTRGSNLPVSSQVGDPSLWDHWIDFLSDVGGAVHGGFPSNPTWSQV